MEDKYFVMVKAYPYSPWMLACGTHELDRDTAEHQKAILTGGTCAAIAIAKVEQVWNRNPEVGEIGGD